MLNIKFSYYNIIFYVYYKTYLILCCYLMLYTFIVSIFYAVYKIFFYVYYKSCLEVWYLMVRILHLVFYM